MKHLHPVIRAKAIDIANELLRQGEDEGRAIRLGIIEAKECMGTNHVRFARTATA